MSFASFNDQLKTVLNCLTTTGKSLPQGKLCVGTL